MSKSVTTVSRLLTAVCLLGFLSFVLVLDVSAVEGGGDVVGGDTVAARVTYVAPSCDDEGVEALALGQQSQWVGASAMDSNAADRVLMLADDDDEGPIEVIIDLLGQIWELATTAPA